MVTFSIAECPGCRPVLPIPFDEIEEHDAWVSEHSAASHRLCEIVYTRRDSRSKEEEET